MKKYLLTIIGEFDSVEKCQEIALALTPIVDSPNLKFQFTKGVLIFHFASEMDMIDIDDFLVITSFGLYQSFILSEYTDKLSVFMSDRDKAHLLDLENGDECGMEMIVVPNKTIEYVNDEDDDAFVSHILNEVKKLTRAPTLDEILEKIKSEGINSLTPFEKGTLEKYSKKY